MKIKKEHISQLFVSDSGAFLHELEAAVSSTKERIANTKIALRLLDYMELYQLTQRQLAEKLGITPQYCSRLLSGRVNVSFAKVEEYFEVLGLHIEIGFKEAKESRNVQENVVARRYKPEQGSPLFLYDNTADHLSACHKGSGASKRVTLKVGWMRDLRS